MIKKQTIATPMNSVAIDEMAPLGLLCSQM